MPTELSPRPRPGPSFGPVMYPSSEIVMPAAYLVIGGLLDRSQGLCQ